MKEQFVTYKIALKLKELGFNEECLAYYHDKTEPYLCRYLDSNNGAFNINCRHVLFDTDCTAPLWQQAIDWFREKHNLYIWIQPINSFVEDKEDLNSLIFLYCKDISSDLEDFENYEQAILRAIELCKKN